MYLWLWSEIMIFFLMIKNGVIFIVFVFIIIGIVVLIYSLIVECIEE